MQSKTSAKTQYDDDTPDCRSLASDIGTLADSPSHSRIARRVSRLGDWVSCRRQVRRLGRLAPARAAALDALPGWTWSGHGRYGHGNEELKQMLGA